MVTWIVIHFPIINLTKLKEKLSKNKILIRFFEWLYFQPYDDGTGKMVIEKIVRLKGINCFLVDSHYGRETLSPVWDLKRIEILIKRFLKK